MAGLPWYNKAILLINDLNSEWRQQFSTCCRIKKKQQQQQQQQQNVS